jgi:hypothetical protein
VPTQPHGRSHVAGRWSERLPGNGFHQGWAQGRGWTAWSGKPKPGRPSRTTPQVHGRDEATLLYPTRSTPPRGQDLSGDRSLRARESSGRRGKPHPIPRPSGGGTGPRWLRFQPAQRTPRRTPLSSTPRSPGSADSSPFRTRTPPGTVGPADHFGRAPCCALPDDRPPIVARQTPTSAPTRRRVSLTQNGWLGFSFSKILLPQWGAPGITDVVVLQSIPPQRIASRISPPAALATGDRYTRHKPVVLQDFWCTYLWTPTMSR